MTADNEMRAAWCGVLRPGVDVPTPPAASMRVASSPARGRPEAVASPGSQAPAAQFRVLALPVMDCRRCHEPHIPSMAGALCGRCLRHLRERQERRKAQNAEYWLEYSALRSEATQ